MYLCVLEMEQHAALGGAVRCSTHPLRRRGSSLIDGTVRAAEDPSSSMPKSQKKTGEIEECKNLMDETNDSQVENGD